MIDGKDAAVAKPTTPKTDEDRIEPETETPNVEATDTVEDAEAVEDSEVADDASEAEEAPGPDDDAAQNAAAGEDANRDDEPTRDAPAAPAPAPDVRRGPGVMPLVLGGVIAAGLGYGAAYMGLATNQQDTGTQDTLATIESTLAGQGDSLTTLSTRTAALEEELAALPPVPDPVDLTPLTEDIEALGTRIDTVAGQISGLTDRIAYLESLPLGETGAEDNSAAIAAAVAQLREQIRAQSENLAAQQAESSALIERIRGIAAEAEASIAAAQERAEARVNAATAQAALGQLRIAVASGAPFGDALSDVTAGAEVPEALSAAAQTGVPTLDRLQATFPAAARAALPVALRDTAGEDAVDRFTAFLQSQVGGRSLDPREGDDPDAVLSRAEAALRSGDLDGAITELAALPEGAQAVMAEWTSAAETRRDALAALDAVAAALDGTN